MTTRQHSRSNINSIKLFDVLAKTTLSLFFLHFVILLYTKWFKCLVRRTSKTSNDTIAIVYIANRVRERQARFNSIVFRVHIQGDAIGRLIGVIGRYLPL